MCHGPMSSCEGFSPGTPQPSNDASGGPEPCRELDGSTGLFHYDMMCIERLPMRTVRLPGMTVSWLTAMVGPLVDAALMAPVAMDGEDTANLQQRQSVI